MDVKTLLHHLRKELESIGHEHESREILEDLFKRDISYLYAHDDLPVDQNILKRLEEVIEARKLGQPLAYIFNKRSFYGRDFFVNSSVLIPRLETEFSIQELLKLPGNSFLELGIGSGCVSITMKLERPSLSVDGVDISDQAIQVAELNAKKHLAQVHFFKSNLFEKVTSSYDLIYSNPPYIKTKDMDDLEDEVKKYEPNLALNGGEDGLDFYKKIIKNTPDHLNKTGYLVLEIGYNQKEEIFALLDAIHFTGKCIQDYGGHDRVIIATRRK